VNALFALSAGLLVGRSAGVYLELRRRATAGAASAEAPLRGA
jgi:hypothetical protein